MKMKRIADGTRVLRSQQAVNTINDRIQLFDGKFTTGFKIRRFDIYPKLPLANEEFAFILSVQPLANLTDNNFQDVTQIGWAHIDSNNQHKGYHVQLDPEAVILEDLYITCRGGTDDSFCNFIIELDKYEFPAWDGAGQMVKNQAQGGNS